MRKSSRLIPTLASVWALPLALLVMLLAVLPAQPCSSQEVPRYANVSAAPADNPYPGTGAPPFQVNSPPPARGVPFPPTPGAGPNAAVPAAGPYPTTQFPTAGVPPTAPAASVPYVPYTPATVPAPAVPAAPVLKPIAEGEIIARVGSQIVMANEVLGRVNEIMEANRDKIPPNEVDTVRRMLMKQELGQMIETKLLFDEAKRKIPKDNFPMVEKKLNEQFEATQLPRLYKATETETLAALEASLTKYGSSIALQKRTFGERALGAQWLRQNVNVEDEISHAEMLDFYQKHHDEFEFEAQARWEQLMVKFERFPSKPAAFQAIADMGNQVWRGAPWPEVAKARSQGFTSERGGQYDWTQRGSLASQNLNLAIFTLPVGQMSQIIEDDTGFHIVRVIERRDAGSVSFVDAQPEIRKKIKKNREATAYKSYLEKLRAQARIWTIFDNDPQMQQAAAPSPRAM